MLKKFWPLIANKSLNPVGEDLRNLYNLSLKTGVNYLKFYNKSEKIICEKAVHFPTLAHFSNFNLNLKDNTWFTAEYLSKLAELSLEYAGGLISFSGFEKKLSILAVEGESYNLIWEKFYAETEKLASKKTTQYLNINSTCSN